MQGERSLMKILAISDLHGDLRLAKIACATTSRLAVVLWRLGRLGGSGGIVRGNPRVLSGADCIWQSRISLELLAGLRNLDGSPILLAQGEVRVFGALRVAGISGIWARSHRLPHYVTDDDVKESAGRIAHADRSTSS